MRSSNILKNTSSLSAWLTYLKTLHDKSIDMSLERVTKVAVRLDLLRPAPFIFTVAGTNGKGTTCRILEIILIESGYKVGVYSSPHLISYTERGRIQNNELSESEHTASFVVIENARGNTSLTYFEFSTLSVLWLFKQAKLDVLILEVGLGGRLDATNVVDTDVAIVTSIALDHTEWLGSDRNSIGREKAGIFRTGKPAIIGELNMPKSIAQVAKEKGARLLRRGIDWNFFIKKENWCFYDRQGELPDLPFPHIPQENAATALAALRASKLNINKHAIYEGISNAILPGRFQIINESPCVILDVAHNPNAIAYLVKRIKTLPKIGRLLAVMSMLYDKDILGAINYMKNIVDFWYSAPIEGPRGISMQQLIKYFKKNEIYMNISDAWIAAKIEAKPEDTILVCGSFHTVAHVMKAIEKETLNKKINL